MGIYKKLDRKHLFEPTTNIKQQQQKINEEHEEELAEYNVLDKTNICEYVNELLDLILATNNQILRLEKEYGKEIVKIACKEWDDKIEEYMNVKYKEVM